MDSTEIVNEEMIQDAFGDESFEEWDSETGEYYEETVEDVTAEPVPQDITGLAVLIFVTSMIVGVMIWNTLSRRWS